MRFQIPNAHKETVNIVRQSAFDRREVITVATGVVCMIVPGTDLINVQSGVAVGEIRSRALLEQPIEGIAEGDIVQRSDNTALQVHRIRAMTNTVVLEFKDEVQP